MHGEFYSIGGSGLGLLAQNLPNDLNTRVTWVDASIRVERRRHPRFRQNEAISLTLLGSDGQIVNGVIVDASEAGMRLWSPELLSTGSLVKLESEDTLLLGEVCYSHIAAADFFLGPGFLMGIELSRALYGLTELRRLNHNLLGAERPVKLRQT